MTGSIKHQLTFGLDFGKRTSDIDEIDREISPLDLFNPIYGSTPGDIVFEFDSSTTVNEFGLVLQDQISFSDNLILLIGMRFNTFEQTDEDLLALTETSQSGDAISPRVGILYKPIQPISLYFNYSQSFEPALGQAFDGSDFEPTSGTQLEIGAKADINERLFVSLALFEVTQSNILTSDPDNFGFSVQTGEQRSRGIELNLNGEILPGWNIFAGYTYLDAEITQDNNIPVGNRVLRTAPNTASLWTTYEIQQGDLQGLGFGLGLFYVDNVAGDSANSFEIPSYVTTDAVIFYRRDGFRAALNFKNLFDVVYYENAFSRLRVSPGAPFTVQGTISWQF